MIRRLATLVCALVAAVPGAPVLAPAGAVPASDGLLHVTQRFSPDGDGRRDEAVVRYRLAGTASVFIRVSNHAGTLRNVPLGRQEAGDHVWRWNGRGRDGEVLSGCHCTITLRTIYRGAQGEVTRDSARTIVDTTIGARVIPRTTYGLPAGKALPVYPRSTEVRDAVVLRPVIEERVRWATLLIKGSSGRTVLRRDVTASEDSGSFTNSDYGRTHPDDVVWTARLRGKPVAPGRYRAFIRARDVAGNIGRSPVHRLWVSRDALELREKTQVVSPQESVEQVCGFLDTSNGCGDPPYRCGTVPASTLASGGLSYQSTECATTVAESWRNSAWALHYLPVPETAGIRGVQAAKVSFAGRPTHDGELDQGTLTLRREDFAAPDVAVSSSTGGETPWVTCPRLCQGMDEWELYVTGDAVPPGVVWSFGTAGTDSVDVERFTVTVRFLAPAR